MDPKNTTLFGGCEIKALFEDGRAETLNVRQFKLREYQSLFPLMDDEIGLVARAISKPRNVVETLSPESYEALFTAVKEANAKGFFLFAARQLERGAATLRSLPAEVVEQVLARGKAASSLPSPILPPPAG